MANIIQFPRKLPPGADRTVEDVFNTMTDEQKQVVYYLVGAAIEEVEKKAMLPWRR